MKIWIIKRNGKTWWGNLLHSHELTYEDNDKAYAQLCFYRKKDAVKFLRTYRYPEFYEVVGAELPKSKQDNRT